MNEMSESDILELLWGVVGVLLLCWGGNDSTRNDQDFAKIGDPPLVSWDV